MPKIERIDHIAVAVESIDKTLAFWRDALGMEVLHVGEVPEERAIVAFLSAGGSEIELVEPTTDDTGLGRFLRKQGPGLHHVCLEVDDIEGMLDQLKGKGIQLVDERPHVGADGRKYAFVHPKSTNGVLVELYELP
jgi:methylmalonyl-CoA/ethylmalonyl-CoA epimerase